jgi:transcriptional regulator with XRE-family HTH domain
LHRWSSDADVAQTVEQLIRNQQVSSSILLIGSRNIKGLSKSLNPLFFPLLPYCYPNRAFFVIVWGNRLRLLREEKGLTQKELAEDPDIDISLPTIQRYESGDEPSAKGIREIAKYFKCKKVWLLSGEGNKYLNAGGPETPPPASYIKEGAAPYASDSAAQKINIDEAWGKTYKILKSGTPYAVALYLNIQQFSGALDATQELHACQDRITKLETQVDALRRQVDGLTAPPVSSDQQADSSEKGAM